MLDLLLSTLRLATPLLFAAMGGLLCERSGLATICLEGVMLMAAWTAAVVAHYTGDPTLAVMAAMLAGALTMSIHSLLTVTAKADQIVSGVAVNVFAAGLTPLLSKALFDSPTNTPSLAAEGRLDPLTLVWIALLLPFVLHWAVTQTRFLLRVYAAGDGPEALATSGVSPARVRYVALAWGGAITALGGAYLSIGHASQFTRDMTAGRGFIALAAVIFGKWRPLPALLACLFFGFADALQIRLQSATIGEISVPVQAIQALPYVVTLLVLVGFVGKATPPRAIGE